MAATNAFTERAVLLLGEEIERDWTPDQRAAWTSFLDLTTRLKRHHDLELEARHALSFSMVGLLGRLAAAEHHALRLTDLAAAMGLSLSRVSRIVDILEERALVERVPCPLDARAINAHLTRKGVAQARRAQATLRAAVQRDFLDGLDDGDAAALAGVLERLLARIGTDDEPCGR